VVREGGDDESSPTIGDAAIVELHETADDAPVVRLVHQLVGQAVEQGASDLHISPDGQDLRVRLRIDGVLRDVTTVPRRLAAGVVSRMEDHGGLDIAERRVPQDGRVGLTVDGHRVDLRVVTVPRFAARVSVMRILDKQAVVMDLAELGMAQSELSRFHRAYTQSHGAVLVDRPDRLRQVDTLYAALSHGPTRPIAHIGHDRGPGRIPARRDHPDPGQSPGRPHLRHRPARGRPCRPDVIMVGEIRDRETAQIAIEAGAHRPPRALDAAHQRCGHLESRG